MTNPATPPDDERDLDFAGVLAELHVLVGEPAVVEVGAQSGPIVLEAKGRLRHLTDYQLDLGVSDARPAVVAFALEGGSTWFRLRESELSDARAYTVESPGGLAARCVQLFFAGGLELIVGADPLAQSSGE